MKKLKERIRKKLKGKAGESLAEVLIALLIAALALTMLASVITSTSRMLTRSKEKMQHYDQANSYVAGMKEPDTDDDEYVEHVTVASNVEYSLVAGTQSIVLDPTRTTVTYYVNAEANGTEVVAYKLDSGKSDTSETD